jgi:hypothetical protein
MDTRILYLEQSMTDDCYWGRSVDRQEMREAVLGELMLAERALTEWRYLGERWTLKNLQDQEDDTERDLELEGIVIKALARRWEEMHEADRACLRSLLPLENSDD